MACCNRSTGVVVVVGSSAKDARASSSSSSLACGGGTLVSCDTRVASSKKDGCDRSLLCGGSERVSAIGGCPARGGGVMSGLDSGSGGAGSSVSPTGCWFGKCCCCCSCSCSCEVPPTPADGGDGWSSSSSSFVKVGGVDDATVEDLRVTPGGWDCCCWGCGGCPGPASLWRLVLSWWWCPPVVVVVVVVLVVGRGSTNKVALTKGGIWAVVVLLAGSSVVADSPLFLWS